MRFAIPHLGIVKHLGLSQRINMGVEDSFSSQPRHAPIYMDALAAGWEIYPPSPSGNGASDSFMYADVSTPSDGVLSNGLLRSGNHLINSRSRSASPTVEDVLEALTIPSPPSKSIGGGFPERSATDIDRRPRTSQGAPKTDTNGNAPDLLAPPTTGSKLDSSGGAAGLFGSSPGSKTKTTFFSALRRQRTVSQSGSNSLRNSSESPRRSMTAHALQSAPGPPPTSPLPKPPKVDRHSFGDDVDAFVDHVVNNVDRTEVPAVLAASGDDFHKEALKKYMRRFLFAGNPLDIALRKLLMSLCLPKETQQIDRVMEAFARRYNECNENLFENDDQPYVLAFSLMMLHTDAFNRNAKLKMTKADYLRNTSSSGVPTEILEYLFDNLTFTEFIYVEDDESTFPNKRKPGEGDVSSALRSALTPSASKMVKTRIDPYYIIATGQTNTLRADIDRNISEDTPFFPKGTLHTYDIDVLNRAFAKAPAIEIITSNRASLNAAGAMSGNFATSTAFLEKEEETIVTLRVTKVGCVSRKDDVVDDNKKAQSRKWKTCGMILSSTQLLFFKDLIWTSALDQQIQEQTSKAADTDENIVISPRITYFKPDGVLALSDAIAVKDTSYTKYNHVFRLIARQGDLSRQYLIQTPNEDDMNDWIHLINFCSTFRALSLRIRGLDPPLKKDKASSSASSVRSSSSTPPISPSSSTSHSVNDDNLPPMALMRRRLIARRKELQPQIEKVTAALETHQEKLEKKLRLARHLSILTPFMKMTRDRIEVVAGPLAQEIRHLRQEIARFSSRRDILRLELDASDRAAKDSGLASFDELELNAKVPWSASTANLSLSPYSLGGSDTGSRSVGGSDIGSRSSSISHTRVDIPDSRGANYLEPPQTRKTFSDDSATKHSKPTREFNEVESTPTPKVIHLHETPETAQRERFPLSPRHEDHDPEGVFVPPLLDSKGLLLSPRERSLAQADSFNWPSPTMSLSSHSSPTHSPATRSSSKFFSAREEPERWNHTKAVQDAKRVSLVALPDPEDWKHLGHKRSSKLSSQASQEPRDPPSTPSQPLARSLFH